jgi:hypothetical protein
MAVDTNRDELHLLVDALPDERLAEAKAALALLTIPEDDEPVTEEERASLDATHEAHLRGELVPHDVAMRQLGLRVDGSPGIDGLSPILGRSEIATSDSLGESCPPSSATQRVTSGTSESSLGVQTSTDSASETGASSFAWRTAVVSWQSPAC